MSGRDDDGDYRAHTHTHTHTRARAHTHVHCTCTSVIRAHDEHRCCPLGTWSPCVCMRACVCAAAMLCTAHPAASRSMEAVNSTGQLQPLEHHPAFRAAPAWQVGSTQVLTPDMGVFSAICPAFFAAPARQISGNQPYAKPAVQQ